MRTAIRTTAAAALLAAPPLLAQGSPEKAAFVATLGRDTVAVERYERTATSLKGDLLLRTPFTRVVHYEATLGPDGRPTRWETRVTRLNPPPSFRPSATVLTWVGDTAKFAVTIGDSTRHRQLVAPAGSLPWLGGGWAMYEAALMPMAAGQGGDRVLAPYVVAGQDTAIRVAITRVGRNAFEVDYFGDPVKVSTDERGRIVEWNGAETTNKVLVRRVPDADIQALAQAFTARDAAGQQMGQLSPRDTVRATVGTATVVVDYGRPSARGRKVWGDVVKAGELWRTGANQATQLETSADLVIGGTTVPAGKYTLWTLWSPQGAQLVVNRKTGQWGTEYDASQDLARIPLQSATAPSPVEQFTIAVEPSGQGAVLALVWDGTRLFVPIAAK